MLSVVERPPGLLLFRRLLGTSRIGCRGVGGKQKKKPADINNNNINYYYSGGTKCALVCGPGRPGEGRANWLATADNGGRGEGNGGRDIIIIIITHVYNTRRPQPPPPLLLLPLCTTRLVSKGKRLV